MAYELHSNKNCSILISRKRGGFMSIRNSIQEQTQESLKAGTISFKKAVSELVPLDEQNDRFFILQRLEDNKPQGLRAPQEKRERSDPFSEEEIAKRPQLVVREKMMDTHNVLLNRFPIIPHHILVCSVPFLNQTEPLTIADFSVVSELLAQGLDDFLVFFNCGPQSGASQEHKHMQMIPQTVVFNGVPVEYPINKWMDEKRAELPASSSSELFTIPVYHFVHAAAFLPAPLTPEHLLQTYRLLIAHVEQTTRITPPFSYNLLFTTKWMLLIPRTRADAVPGLISVNSLGFAGTIVTRSDEAASEARKLGLFNILEKVTFALAET